MRVFVTGATGFIGSAVVQELLANGHQVLGLARSDAAATALAATGADVQRGSLEDLGSLRNGAAETDGVIHTAFIHDFSKYAENGAIDKRAIEAMADTLANSGRPLVVSAGLALLAPGRLATEEMAPPSADVMPRVSEQSADAAATRGLRASTIRLAPTVHGQGDHGFVPMMIGIARQKGVAAYIGDGENRWPAVHRLDAATLYRLALENGVAGARYHGTGEEGVRMKDIAAVIGKRLNLPVASITKEEAPAHFGFLAMFASTDMPASNAKTRESLGWSPTHPGLIADLDQDHYFAA